MEDQAKLTLICPIRGTLKAIKKSKDGLTPTEEYHRVEAIKYLLSKGYPKENFKIEPILKKFGSSGRNYFRCDFAVLRCPTKNVKTNDPDTLLEHSIILCEVKRDNAKYDYVKKTQVQPMLDFAKRDKCIGLYWDNIEQRIFWNETEKGKKITKEAPLTFLPDYGNEIKTNPLTFNDTHPTDSLIEVFERIEDILHQKSFDLEKRYEIILQLLLAKIFDEHALESQPKKPLEIQDFSVLGTPHDLALEKVEKVLNKAVSYYEKHLPNKVPKKLPIGSDTLVEILKILAPIRIIHSKRSVIQTFYMKFAKHLYRWDLAQFFTPTTVTDFIIELLNPQFGEHINDPACGSADFLIASFHRGRKIDKNYSDCIWGSDNSSNAVQISVLNMLLNGDGKTNITKEDSLENILRNEEKYDIVVCNPPFGTKIIEKRSNVLRNYDLGFEWELDNGKFKKTNKLLGSQEAGILFTELCVRQCKGGGRIGIILPNGYLGNRSNKYISFRTWLLKNARIVSICSFPRFTFKTSGADVSASVLILEKRKIASNKLQKENYRFNVEMIEKVGWDAGNKKASPIYKRNEQDGSFIIDEHGELIIDSDFQKTVNRVRNSKATNDFPWLIENVNIIEGENGWSVPIQTVLSDNDLTLDPKRHCEKATKLIKSIKSKEFVKLGDLVDFIDENTDGNGNIIRPDLSRIYNYVELQDIGYGDYHYKSMRGWELPSRARHFAQSGDIYFGSIWGSVSKWCYIGNNARNLVVTNGCHRCRLKEGKENYIIDLLAFINTEAWAVQLRSLTRGSDGLAEVTESDTCEVVIPLILNEDVRSHIERYKENLIEGKISLKHTIDQFIKNKSLNIPTPAPRFNHIVLV